jgi:hypothetical protein
VILLINIPPGPGLCRCELLHRWGLPCRHYLLRAHRPGQPIPRSLVHPRYWLQGQPIQDVIRQPRYPEEELQAYNELVRVEARSTTQTITQLRDQMALEEKARFDCQVEAEQQKLIVIARDHVELQALPIGNPDANPKRRFRKKKTHALTNARGLSGTETAALDLRMRETRNTRVRRERTAATPSDDEDDDEDDEEEGVTTVLDTPPRPITLAIRSPEAPPPLSRAPSPPELMTVSQLFPEGPFVPPASTAPPRLADDEGRPKWKRAPTQGRYKDAAGQGNVSKPRETQYQGSLYLDWRRRGSLHRRDNIWTNYSGVLIHSYP